MPKETFLNLGEEKQEKVMRASISEFVDKGFEKANVGIIAKNAGVAKGSIYQYFDNKKELFLFSMNWATRLIIKKFDVRIFAEGINIFTFLTQNAREMWNQLREEREIAIFLQDVLMGRFSGVRDESLDSMLKNSEEFMLHLIREGKKNGYIRDDIDDNIILLFLSGASVKFKQYIINKAREGGENLVEKAYEDYGKEINAIMDLIKNGMGVK